MSVGTTRPLADLSLDLDNKWSYLKTQGDAAWKTLPTYLPQVVPMILSTLAEHNLRITFMIVGQDAEREENLTALRSIAAAGHEIGNHSFKHEPWLQTYTWEEVSQELQNAETALAKITEQKLIGFRGPGYCLSPDILDWLANHGYRYDASTFPTFLGPLARAYLFFRSSLSKKQRDDRGELFGSLADGFRRLKPYTWRTNHGELLEIPVTTTPLFRTPFHFTYLHYLGQYSQSLAVLYFRLALLLCRLTKTPPSMLLHPLDFLGGDDVPELNFFPGMKSTGENKRAFVSKILKIVTNHYRVIPMGERANSLLTQSSNRLPSYAASTLG